MKLLTQWAITSSALILIVLAARYLLRDKLSARLRYALWGVVLLRLLVPFQVELPAAAGSALPVLASNLAPEVADVELYALRTYSRPLSEDSLAEMRERGVDAGTVIGTEAPIHQIGDVEIEGYAHCFVLSDTGIDTYFFYTTLPKFLMTLWVIGAVWVALTIFRSNRYFFGRLKYYRHELEGVEAPIPVYTAANLPSPCLFGVFHPAVYLNPGAADDPSALRHILAHELTHYAHRDHLWSLLRCLALALHWYSPLVWLAVALSKQDGELACDEGAVARLGEAERIPYGRTLVDMVAARSLRPRDLLSCSTAMTGGKKSIQRRVARLVRKPETVKAALFAAVAVVALGLVFAFAERSDLPEPDAFRAELEAASSIELREPGGLGGGSLSDPDLVDQAKKQLRLLQPAAKREDNSYTILSLSSDTPPEPISQNELKALLSTQGHNLILFPSNWKDVTVSFYYYLAPRGNQCLLLRAYVKNEEGSVSVLGAYPATVLDQLKALAQQQKIRSGPSLSPLSALSQFQTTLENAVSIRYAPPLYSSTAYPNPITDPDLLAQAKEVLRSAALLGPDDPEPDRGTLLHASTAALTLEDGSVVCYTLLPQNSYTYVLEGAVTLYSNEYTQQGPWYSAAFRSEEDIIPTLESLARQQNYRNREDLTPASYDYNIYYNRLYAAKGIWLGMPMLHDGRVLTDPEQLEQVKDLLTLTPIPRGGPLEWDGDNTDLIAFSLTQPDPDWTGADASYSYYILATDEGFCYVCSGSSREGGYYIGTISKENWDQAEEILQSAPSVDDRKHAQSALLGDLTQEQVDRANEAFRPDAELPDGSWGPTEISCFFTSSYDDPTQIDLEEFLAYCPIGITGCLGEEDVEEFQAVIAKDGSWDDWEYGLDSPGDLPVPTHRYPRTEVSALLQKYAGVSVEELDWSNCLYVEEYDAFYNFTSDYGPGFFPCAGGRITGDTVLLWSEPNGDGDRCELTLRKSGENWLIQSHHTIYER